MIYTANLFLKLLYLQDAIRICNHDKGNGCGVKDKKEDRHLTRVGNRGKGGLDERLTNGSYRF